MRNAKPDLAVHVRTWIESKGREGSFGDGRVRLLQAIDAAGSLRAAAEALGISYRKAWGDLKDAEACFARPLLEKTRGGADGGRTVLTAEGRALIDGYLAFRKKVDAAVGRAFGDLLRRL
jgi:molybdate transport system regulatory protein